MVFQPMTILDISVGGAADRNRRSRCSSIRFTISG
jgi:hypothetical protein